VGRRTVVASVRVVSISLHLNDEEQAALRARADREGVSEEEIARRAVRSYVDLEDHRDRVASAAARVIAAHQDALDRLGR